LENWPKPLRYLSLVHFLIPLVGVTLAFMVGGIKVSSTCLAMIDKIQPRPVFLIHGTADNRFRTRQTEGLFKKLTHEAKGSILSLFSFFLFFLFLFTFHFFFFLSFLPLPEVLSFCICFAFFRNVAGGGRKAHRSL